MRCLLVGQYSDGDVTVIVSEDVASLRSAVIGDELFWVIGIVLMGIAAATIVHLLLVHLVSRPLDALVEKVKSVELAEGTRLAISTDGITETFGADDEMFSKERLLSTLLECRSRSLAETNQSARRLVDAHRGTGVQTDDVTLLLMESGAVAPLQDTASNELQGFIHQAFQSPLGS